MSTFSLAVATTLPTPRAFEVATDWSGHSRVPFTTVVVTRPTEGVGTRFVGRTGLGPLGFDDPMEVVEWEAPAPGRDGHCRVVKLGTVVRGEATIDVTPGPDGGSVVHWQETALVGPPWLSRLAGPGVRLAGPWVFGAVLRSQLREAERGMPRG